MLIRINSWPNLVLIQVCEHCINVNSAALPLKYAPRGSKRLEHPDSFDSPPPPHTISGRMQAPRPIAPADEQRELEAHRPASASTPARTACCGLRFRKCKHAPRASKRLEHPDFFDSPPPPHYLRPHAGPQAHSTCTAPAGARRLKRFAGAEHNFCGLELSPGSTVRQSTPT